MSPDQPAPRVVLLTRSLEHGGAERQVGALAEGLHRRGIPVRVVSFYPGGALAAPLRAAGVDVVHAAKRSRWDLVGFGWRLATAVGGFEPTVLYGFLNGPNLVSLVLAPIVGRPAVVWGVRSTTMDLSHEDRFVSAAYTVEARLSRWADVVICNSSAGRDDARDRGMDPDRLVVVPNGIDTGRFSPRGSAARGEVRGRWGVPADALVVGAVGRLHPMKDYPTLVAATARLAADHPDLHVVVVGSDPAGLGPDLERRAVDAGLGDRLHLVGPTDDVAGALAGFDLLVSSSSYGEGFSNVVAEAMACAVPCVATRVGDAARLVGDTGIVVAPGDTSALGRAIEQLVAEPEPVRRARGDAARTRIVERFDIDRLVDRTLAALGSGDAAAPDVVAYGDPVPLRVVHVINGLEVGGAERMLVKLLAATDRTSVRPAVVSLLGGGALQPAIEALGIPVVTIGLEPSRPDPRALVRLVRALRDLRPDVVQTWLYKADVLGGLASRMARRPALVWSLRQSDPRRASRSNRAAARAGALLSARLPDRIVAVSDESVAGHRDFGYDGARMVVVPNGFDTAAFHPDPIAAAAVREELGVDPDAPLVGLVARFDPQKDHRTFASAAAVVAARVPAARFVLVGTGIDDRNAELVGWLTRAGVLDRTHLLGVRTDIARLTSAFDVAVSSSVGEGFSNALGEAMACAVVPVATDVGNARELLGGLGTVVPPGQAEALGAGVAAWLERPTARRAEGEAARHRIVEHYGIGATADTFADLYRDLWEQRHVRHRRPR